MTTTKLLRCSGAVLAVLLLATACASSKPKQPTLSITSGEGEDSSNLSITLSSDLARSALEAALGTKLDCKGELDPDVAAVLGSLQQKGRSGRVTRQYDDGRLVARRRGSTLHLEFESRDDDGKLEAVMPWAVAECLLGRSMTLADALGHGKQTIKVKLTGEDGESFEVRLN